MTRVLTLPGYLGSGAQHWQSQWERLDARITRVEQADWAAPDRDTWCARLDADLQRSFEPTLLVAHSLGAVLVAHWAAQARAMPVVGALLVAPADVETLLETMPELPPSLASFAPVPRGPLPFASVLVASRDDTFMEFGRARGYADSWGARFVDAGAAGHINADSGLGTWSAGRALLAELRARTPFSLDARLAADTVRIGESALSLLLMMNDARYPWFILVPKRSHADELFDLDDADQRALARESHVLAGAVGRLFGADKVNVGALGNVVRQLHVHVLARRLDDPAWPGPVWGHSARVPYQDGDEREVAARLFGDPAVAAHFMLAV